MSVLIIGNIAVQNPANLGPYKVAAAESMKEYGIELVGQAAPTPMLEGTFDGMITVILKAESEERAREWYASESYTAAIALRSEDSKFTLALVHTVGG